MIDRRTFLAGTGAVLLAAPLAADAQLAGKVPRIGFLGLTSSSDRPPLLDAFRQGLRELAINTKTAKALGLTIQPSLLARADEVIQ